LVEAAVAAAKSSNARRVTAVKLELGALSGVMKDALLFSYDIAVKATILEGSQLQITETPVVIYCDQCDKERTLPGIRSFRCPVCDKPSPHIRKGRELEIIALEIEE
jgi:hydrogenase nickel incorporation protein HypA/HybF